jgi:hypothetical protein
MTPVLQSATSSIGEFVPQATSRESPRDHSGAEMIQNRETLESRVIHDLKKRSIHGLLFLTAGTFIILYAKMNSSS